MTLTSLCLTRSLGWTKIFPIPRLDFDQEEPCRCEVCWTSLWFI